MVFAVGAARRRTDKEAVMALLSLGFVVRGVVPEPSHIQL